MSDTVHVVVGWNDEYENGYAQEANQGDAEDSTDEFEFDVPAALWERLRAAQKAHSAALAAITEHVGFHEGRLSKVCPEWQGHEYPSQSWFEVVLSASGSDNEWPVRGHLLWTEDAEDAAEAVIAALPDEFYVHYGAHRLVKVTRDRLSIREGGYAGHASPCTRCGWGRDEHGTKS